MFIATVLTVAKRRRQLRCPPSDEQVNKTLSIHTMKGYSVIKRNEVLLHADIDDLKNFLLSGRRQTQKVM